jgi:signal transduction histidine kinase
MPAHPSQDSRQEVSAGARALTAGAVALVVTGAGLAWAVLAAPQTEHEPIAVGGGVAAVVIIAAVAIAAYYACVARGSRRNSLANELKVRRLESEFAQLAGETLPSLVRRVRGGAEPDAILAEPAAPATAAARSLLNTVLHEVTGAERHAAMATAKQTALETEIRVLAHETVPAALAELRDGQPADAVLTDVPRPNNWQLSALLDVVVGEVAVAEHSGATAMVACASAAARIQAQTTRLLAELREMENRHGGEEKIFGDLMELDHRVSQMGRLADSIALLAGGRSGRRWTRPIPMESILRGAMSRIDAYQRIRVHSTSAAAVVGYAAEGVMHALAELMDNAAAFSAHVSEVHVYVEEEDVGVVITIEDSGLGMRKRERGRAEELIAQPFSLATLPGTRLGLAVVGRVADRYGLNVNFRPSSRGGTGVVVMVPRQLLAQHREEDDVLSGGAEAHIPSQERGFAHPEEESGMAMEPVSEPPDVDDDDEELPVRPRGRTLAAASVQERETVPTRVIRQPSEVGSRFAAFRETGERPRSTVQSVPEDEAT